MTWVSENVLIDTIYALGLMICFYYGLTAFAAVWFFRRDLRDGVGPLVLKGVMPFVGGLTLAAIFLKLCVDSLDPEYGSGGSIFGVGSVFVIGMGLLGLGVVVMLAWQSRAPSFFRGETLRRDTPTLVPEESP